MPSWLGPWFEAGLWQQRELQGNVRLDAATQRVVLIEHILLVLERETRILVHELEEGLQVARETDLCPHLVELGGDARHFVESDLVDVLGREVGGRVALRQLGVPGGAVRQRRQTDRCARGRQIVVAQEIAQAHESRQQLRADQIAIGGGQALAIRRPEALGHLRDHAPHQRVFGLLLDQRIELRNRLLDQHAWLHHAGLHARAQVHDGLIEDRHEGDATLQPRLVVGHGRERLATRTGTQLRDRRGRIAELTQRQHPIRILRHRDRALALRHEDVERRRIDGLHARQPFPVQAFALGAEFGCQGVGQFAVVARVAERGRTQRVALELFLPVRGIQRFKLRGRGNPGRGNRIGLRSRRPGRTARHECHRHHNRQHLLHRSHSVIDSDVYTFIDPSRANPIRRIPQRFAPSIAAEVGADSATRVPTPDVAALCTSS